MDDDILDLFLNETPQRCQELNVRSEDETGDFLVIFDQKRNNICTINSVGKKIFNLSDGERSLGEILKILKEDFDVKKDFELLESSLYFIRDMQKKGIFYYGSAHMIGLMSS
jgi:hypothetical protein